MTRQLTTNDLAVSPQWFGIGALTACSAILSMLLACATPFAALATLAVLFLPRRRVLAAAIGVWLANQAVGYLLLDYPHSSSSYAWGAMIGVGLMAAACAARAASDRLARQSRLVAGSLTYLAAFAGFQAMMAVGYALLGGTMTFAGILAVFRIDILAFLGLLLVVGLIGKVTAEFHHHGLAQHPVSHP